MVEKLLSKTLTTRIFGEGVFVNLFKGRAKFHYEAMTFVMAKIDGDQS